MKRFFLVILIIILTVLSAKSQPKSFGLRLGNDEFDLGMQFYYGYAVGLNAAAAYNFMIAQPDWSGSQTWLCLDWRLSGGRCSGWPGV